jgi:hypothetical protein
MFMSLFLFRKDFMHSARPRGHPKAYDHLEKACILWRAAVILSLKTESRKPKAQSPKPKA